MSTIKNDSFQTKYGESITSGEVNNKYTDARTASLSIDADNVRDEGIDRENLTGTPTLKRMEYSFNNVRTDTLYSFRTDSGRSGFPLEVSRHQLTSAASGGDYEIYLTDDGTSTGSPTTINTGDLLRIKYAFNFVSNSIIGDSQVSVIPETQTMAYIIFPQYKATSGGSWNTFPNKKDWDVYGDDGPEGGETFSINTDDDGDGTNEDDGVIFYSQDGVTSTSPASSYIKHMQMQASMNILAESNFDIHTIGFFIIGPIYFTDDSPFTGSSRGWETWDTTGGTEVVRIEKANFGAIVLQKGKG